MFKSKRERYEKRLFRILANAGYNPKQVMKMSVNEILEVDGITVPNIRTLLFLQSKFAGGKANDANEPKLYHHKQPKCGRS